jgi:hypothetical protein
VIFVRFVLIEQKKTFKSENQPAKLNNTNKRWFNKTCRTARKQFHLARRLHSKAKSNETLANVKLISKEYKKTINKCMKE